MAEYQIKNTEKHQVTAFYRKRSISYERFLRQPVKIVSCLGLMALLAILIHAKAYLVSLFIASMIVLLALGPKLDYWIMLWRFRRSSACNIMMQLVVESDKFSWDDPLSKGEAQWNVFDKVYRLKDGFLIFYQYGQFQWWPDACISTGTVDEVAGILRSQIAKYSENC
ncbi:hypothetical protein [Undibacterium sp. TJN19]|uniref:hypothetical protein n=1 Tax=Undibacterium sp. TJN19 TaxID=3413055 RepID=UPI003BF0F570